MALINTNKQVWILTTYGLERITKAMESPSVERLYLTKIKIGDANGTYYVPIQGQDNDLRHPIYNEEYEILEFPITEKSVEDTTVTLKSFISETSGGYNIREIGLYETVNGQDFCFALGTCEPIVKPAYDPAENYGYAMAIDYALHINSVNLASVYDQIILDSSNEYVTKELLEALSRTVLFVEGNLMDQISINSHLLGLNRAQQLSELIETTRNAYANSILTSLYSNVLMNVGSEDIKGFWGFNYVERYDKLNAVKDFSIHGNNLSLNKPISTYETGRFDIAPYVLFTNEDYFYLPFTEQMLFDDAFTIFFAGEINTANVVHTILAQSNPYIDTHNWSIQINENNAIVVKIYTDNENYKSYTSASSVLPAGPFSLAVVYKNKSIHVYLNLKEITMVESVVGTFTGLARNALETSSYVYNGLGSRSDNINSKVSFLSAISKAVEDPIIRATNLNLLSAIGKNIYRG